MSQVALLFGLIALQSCAWTDERTPLVGKLSDNLAEGCPISSLKCPIRPGFSPPPRTGSVMPARIRKSWKPNNQGVYERQIGWKTSRNGNRVQHKFRFTCVLKEAQRREHRIVELWERIEATTIGRNPQWTDVTIEIAKQIAAGRMPIQIQKEDGEDSVAYVQRVRRLRDRFPTMGILPELEYGHIFGMKLLDWLDDQERSLPTYGERQEQIAESLRQHLGGTKDDRGPTEASIRIFLARGGMIGRGSSRRRTRSLVRAFASKSCCFSA